MDPRLCTSLRQRTLERMREEVSPGPVHTPKLDFDSRHPRAPTYKLGTGKRGGPIGAQGMSCATQAPDNPLSAPRSRSR